MKTTLARKELTEKALKVFLLHFYSLDWLLPFLLETRCNRLIVSSSSETLTDCEENDILLCVRAGIQLFPTARGLEAIDKAVRGGYKGLSRPISQDFYSLRTSVCTSTRYRMSLFAMADRARESHHDDLASLWMIAATAKLDHVSAYQAYAAAKEEEARVLNYKDEAEYWKTAKFSVGDLAQAEFDKTLLTIRLFVESKAKDQAFRSYLQSKADTSLHELIDTCDLSGPMLLAIWCNIKSHSVQHEVTSSMWKLASELSRTEEAALVTAVATKALEFDKIVKRLSSVAASYRAKDRVSPTHSLIWEKAAVTVEYAVAKVKASIVLLTVTDLKGQLETLKTSIVKVKDIFIADSYYSKEKRYFLHLSDFDSLLKKVHDLLPVLIAHPDHSFPELKLILHEKCEQWRNDLERYVEIADAYIRCRIEGNEPSEQLLKDAKLLGSEQSVRHSLLTDYHRFLLKTKLWLQELTKESEQANEIESRKRDLYAQAVHTIVDSMQSMHVHGGWFADQWRRVSFLQMGDAVFDQIRAISDFSESDINLLIVDVSLQIIKNQKPLKAESNIVRLLKEARESLLASQDDSDHDEDGERERKSPLELIEIGRRYHEMAKRLLKIEEIRLTLMNENRTNELFLRLFVCFDLTLKSFLCIDEIADAEYDEEQKAIPFRSKADKYFKAIEALSVGDVVKALAYEQEALNIEIE